MQRLRVKPGILLAAFGSSNPSAQRTLNRFDRKVREAFPGIPIRWAFTSGYIRRKLADGGVKTDSAAKALSKMAFEKFTHVAVQSLHVVPGVEYNELLKDAASFEKGFSAPVQGLEPGFDRIVVGSPLLATNEDAQRAALAVLQHLPPGRAPQEGVALMGHGTWHPGASMYDVLAEALRGLDPLIRIGTMESAAGVHDIARDLRAAGVTKVWLMPLLAVAGAHVRYDMLGEHPESWKSVLLAAGLECEPVLTSAAEYDGFAAIWIAHLHEAMSKLG
jgi:sirohydrochlorin cobaltochelatase